MRVLELPRLGGSQEVPLIRIEMLLVASLAGVGMGAGWAAGGPWPHLAVIGAAILVGELAPFRLLDGSTLPLSLAAVLVLVRAAEGWTLVGVVLGAQALAAIARRGVPLVDRAEVVVRRAVGAEAALSVFRLVEARGDALDDSLRLVSALTAAALCLLGVELLARRLRRATPFSAAGGWGAALALTGGGVPMAAAYAGTTGGQAMGLWSVGLFAVPLLAARYAYERRHAVSRAYDQTIRALSAVPELGGMCPPGHGERVADLACAVGRRLGLGTEDLGDLERAALLHELGQVVLDTDELRSPITPRDVCAATAGMLRDARGLERAADLVAAMPEDPVGEAAAVPAAQVLKAASAFDDVAVGDPERVAEAVESLRGGASPTYDPRVLTALEQELVDRGDLAPVRHAGPWPSG